MRAGGNAYDALIAAYLSACTAEPAMASMGAGALILHQQSGQKVVYTDAFCQTPQRKGTDKATNPITVSWDAVDEIYHTGAASVAVPGVMMGLWNLHRRYGHMTWKECCLLGRDVASSGVALNSFQHLDINLLRDIFAQSTDLSAAVLDDQGEVRPIGSLIRIPDLAASIDVIAHEGIDILYQGEIAHAIAEITGDEGHLRVADLQQYRTIDSTPLHFLWKGHSIYTPDKPSLGGYILAALLHEVHTLDLLVPRLAQVRRCGTDLAALAEISGINAKNSQQSIAGGTSHMSIADAKGNHVCMSFSLGEGSGVVVPGTGIHLNNMLGEPSLLPDGIGSWIPASRLRSMMTPLIAVSDQDTVLAGTGGADRIPYILAQFLVRFLKSSNLEEAIKAPRCNLAHGTFHTEPGWSESIAEQATQSIWTERNMYFGGVHAIASSANDTLGSADNRREGCVLRG